MKLKQRLTVGVGLAIVGLVVFLLPAFMDSPVQTHLNGMFVPGHRREETGLNSDEVRANMDDAGDEQPLHGHLNVIRKDLDVSNYSSVKDNSQGGDSDPNKFNLRLPLNLPETELVEYILKDKNIAHNAEKLIHIAHVLEKSRQMNGLIPANLTKEFVPDKGDIVLPGGIYNNLDVKYPWERRKVPKRVDLSAQEFKEFEHIVTKMTGPHHKKKGKRKGARMTIYNNTKNLTHWQRWHNTINQFDLYRPDDPLIDQLMHDLQTMPFQELYQHEGGTQLKIVYYMEDDGRAMFKPMRYPRDVETLPDHFYFSDYERHTAEIAAFHLDRILTFHRVPPTTGRIINVTSDVKEMADSHLLKTFFISPAGNICFYGHCDYYCDDDTAFCGHPDMLQGMLQSYLPSERISPRTEWENPWRRSYHKRKKAEWETNNNYCYQVRETPPYNTGRRLIDLMDMAVFDFLQGNLDRHHYETFEDFGNYTFTLHLDNGRGFGKSLEDDLSILAPIYQCCLFRYSTMEKLVAFHRGPRHLSDVMRTSLATDPVAPVLLERHLVALDRRVNIILKTVHKCIARNGLHKVVVDDGF